MTIQQHFWEWFKNHEDELFKYDLDREAVFDKLATQLQTVDPRLSFEIGPDCAGKREFIISASGIKGAFSAVELLVDCSPQLERWTVLAFRPRRADLSTIEYGDSRISPNDIQFSLLHNGKTIGIYLFIPGYSDENLELKQIGYLFLDEALGEFDVESNVGLIKMFSTLSSTQVERRPLCELSRQFDKLFEQLSLNSTRQP